MIVAAETTDRIATPTTHRMIWPIRSRPGINPIHGTIDRAAPRRKSTSRIIVSLRYELCCFALRTIAAGLILFRKRRVDWYSIRRHRVEHPVLPAVRDQPDRLPLGDRRD